MKTNRMFFILAAVAAIASCKPIEPEVEAPSIELASDKVQLTAEGESVQVAYNIVNATEGTSLTVTEDAEWLEVNTAKPRILEFSAALNDTDAVRQAEVTISYEGAEAKVITVSQDAWVAPLSITVLKTDATTATFSVAAADADLTWVAQCVGKEWWDSYETEAKVFEEDMSYFQWMASDLGVSLQEYLSSVLLKGSKESLRFKGLDPLSDYVIYVYGMTTEGEPTTSIYSAQISTTEPYDGPITFDIQVSEENHVMDITITPSHEGVPYYWDIMDEATFNEWGGEVPSAIQSYIDFEVEDYLYWGDIYDVSEYFEWFSTSGTNNSQFESIAGTKYIIYASKWGPDCKLTGETEYVWFETAPVEPSDNQITVTASNPTQSSFAITTTTTNNDPYVILAEPSEWCGWNEMSDQEIYDYVMAYYGTWMITDYICQGNLTEARFYDLDPGTEYTVIAFGYEAGTMTTAVQKTSIRTLDAGNPEDCTFQFEILETNATSIYAKVSPSDSGYDYYWFAYDVNATADDVKSHISGLVDEWYYGDFEEFAYWELSKGTSEGEILYLNPETDYKLGAVLMGNNGEFLSDVHFSEPFKTLAMQYADITVSATYDKYYDGDALAAAVADQYDQYKGFAMLPVEISVEGDDYAELYCAIFTYEEGIDDPNIYSDVDLYGSLIEYGYIWGGGLNVNYRAPWDTKLMIAAMAMDYEGNYSPVYRHAFTLTKDGAAPVEDLIGTKSADLKATAVSAAPAQQKIQVKRARTESSDLFSTKVVNAKKAECKAKKAEQKRDAAVRKLELSKKAVKPISDKRYFAE